MNGRKVDRTLEARRTLRRGLADLVQRHPELTAPESQARAQAFIENEENAMVERDRQIHFRASADEMRMLAELAEHNGLSGSDWIRQAIRRAHADVFGPAKPPKSPKRPPKVR